MRTSDFSNQLNEIIGSQVLTKEERRQERAKLLNERLGLPLDEYAKMPALMEEEEEWGEGEMDLD